MKWLKVAVVASIASTTGAFAQDTSVSGDVEVIPQDPMSDDMRQGDTDIFVEDDVNIGGSGEEGLAPPSEQTTEIEATQVAPEETRPTFSSSSRREPDLKGVQLQVGGGVEGYTGDYDNSIEVGPGWDVVADMKPWKAMGLELGYSGAANELDQAVSPGDGPANGPDLIRNGGHAAVIVGLPTAVSPYVLGGVGIDRYTFRGEDGEAGFSDDTSGSVPLGVGLRSTMGRFTADLRFNYSLLFSDEFSPATDADVTNGRYQALLNVGGAF